jgi:hypothetical protein
LQEYYSNQADYRNNNLLEHESKLKKSKEKLELTMELSTKSLSKYLIGMERVKLKESISDDRKIYNENISNVKNILLSYLLEYKNTYLSLNELANKETDYIKFNKLKKKYSVYKYAHNLLRSNVSKLTFLALEDIDDLISSLNDSITN